MLGEYGRLPECSEHYVKMHYELDQTLHIPNDRYPSNCYKMLKGLDNISRYQQSNIYPYTFEPVWHSQDDGDGELFIIIYF